MVELRAHIVSHEEHSSEDKQVEGNQEDTIKLGVFRWHNVPQLYHFSLQ